MPTFSVSVLRVGYGEKTIEVEADSLAEANEKALNVAPNLEFSENASDYELTDHAGNEDRLKRENERLNKLLKRTAELLGTMQARKDGLPTFMEASEYDDLCAIVSDYEGAK